MLPSIKTMSRAMHKFAERRATAHALSRLDARILRDIGLEDWRARF